MQLSLLSQDLSLSHLLLHVKEAIEDQPTIIQDLESLIERLKRKKTTPLYMYDHTKKMLFYKGTHIKLTHKERLLLEFLIKHENRVITYIEIQNYVWHSDVMTDNSIRSLVRNLRKKLPDGMIENYSKVGYKLNAHTNFSSF